MPVSTCDPTQGQENVISTNWWQLGSTVSDENLCSALFLRCTRKCGRKRVLALASNRELESSANPDHFDAGLQVCAEDAGGSGQSPVLLEHEW